MRDSPVGRVGSDENTVGTLGDGAGGAEAVPYWNGPFIVRSAPGGQPRSRNRRAKRKKGKAMSLPPGSRPPTWWDGRCIRKRSAPTASAGAPDGTARWLGRGTHAC